MLDRGTRDPATMGTGRRKGKRSAAVASVDDANEAMASAEALCVEHQDPPLASAEGTDEAKAANGEVTAVVEPDEPRRDSSPERGDGDAARLKLLNGILIRTASEERERVAALEARLAELSADAAVLADGESAVLLAAFSAQLRAVEEEQAALLDRIAVAQESLERAQAEAASEARASADATARLQEAIVENGSLSEQLRAKADEADAAAERVAGLEAAVAGLESQISDLRAKRSEFESQLEAMRASARAVQSEKDVLESSFNELKKENEAYKQEMEATLQDQLKDSEALQSRKVELEAKVGSLEAQLSEAVARNHGLELELDKLEVEMAATKAEVEKLQALLEEMDQKQIAVDAEVARLQSEIDQVAMANEAAAGAHEAEKKMVEAELEMLKVNVDRVQAEKDGALVLVNAKDAEVGKLRDELKKLHSSMAELRALFDDLNGKSSFLHDEKVLVLKELEQEKAEAEKLKFKIQELESYNRDNVHEIGVLKAEVGDRDKQINDLNSELEQVQLAVVDAERSGKNVVWTWLCPATTTVLAAASFVYAARSR